jgi:hypothetical protein
MSSCKSILISYVCNPNLNIIILVISHFDRPFTKKSWYFNISPNISIFHLYGTMVALFQGILWIHILSHIMTWIKLLFLILYATIFGLNFYKNLVMHVLWFILIN